MRCHQVEKILLDGLEARLTASETSTLTYHLETCASCRRVRLQTESVRSAAHGLRTPDNARGIAERALAAAGTLAPVRRPFVSGRGFRFVLSGAVGVLVLAGWLIVNHRLQAPIHRQPDIARTSPQQAAPRSGDAKSPTPMHAPLHKEQLVIDHPHSPGQRTVVKDLVPYHAPRVGGSSGLAPRVQDDLTYLNASDTSTVRKWIQPQKRAANALSPRLQRLMSGDDFVYVPMPQIAASNGNVMNEALERYRQERAVVDERLGLKKVSLEIKGASFQDIVRRLTESTGIQIRADHTVAEDKATLFCKDKPLRDLMRQINQVFGYQWRRIGKPDAYEYELYQDLKSQLAEEAMRTRNRDEALLDLDKKMQAMRKFLALSPDEAHKKAWDPDRAGTPQEDLNAYNTLAGSGWAGAHLYFNLTNEQQAALRDGDTLQFSSSPGPGQQQLSQDMANSVVSSLRGNRVFKTVDGRHVAGMAAGNVGQALSEFPDAQKLADLHLDYNVLGQVSLWGGAGVGIDEDAHTISSTPIAVGISASVQNPNNAEANAALASDTMLKGRVNLTPRPSVWGEDSFVSVKEPWMPNQRVTTADVLEAIHHATGMDIVSDYFTRLYLPAGVTIQNTPLFDALNGVCDKMRVRWTRKEGWLRFRSASFFVDRLTEVSNTHLARWAAARKKQGWLTPEIMMEIAQLPNAKLDAYTMGDGARECFGLREWYLASSVYMRPHWRFLAALPSGLRNDALQEKGLPLTRLTVAQQSRWFALGLAADMDGTRPRQRLDQERLIQIHRNNETGYLAASKIQASMPPFDVTYRFEDPSIGSWKVQIRLEDSAPIRVPPANPQGN